MTQVAVVTDLAEPDGLPDTWQPVDLAPYLDGTIRRPEPTIGVSRDDGVRMLYPAREHSVIGEMECGKSWFAAACVAAELLDGNHVVYTHFEEADPSDTVERLQALGVPRQDILARFRFVGPDRPVNAAALALLLDPAPTLVILDGVNEAMSLHGMGIRDEDGAAAYRRRLVMPCTRAGAAVLSCDHVVKDPEKRGRYALGSVHKGNGLSGALIQLENAEPFGRGQRGCSHVFVMKDRPGHLRRNGRADKKTSGKTYFGSLVVDDRRTRTSYLDLVLLAPRDPDDAGDGTDNPPLAAGSDPGHSADDDAVLDVVAKIHADGKQANLRTVRAHAAGMGKDRTEAALERLVYSGRLAEASGPRNSRIFTPTTVAQDQLSGDGPTAALTVADDRGSIERATPPRSSSHSPTVAQPQSATVSHSRPQCRCQDSELRRERGYHHDGCPHRQEAPA